MKINASPAEIAGLIAILMAATLLAAPLILLWAMFGPGAAMGGLALFVMGVLIRS